MPDQELLNCAIIDDEPLARECIVNYVNEISYLHIIGTGSNPIELADLMATHPVDLIFLDIQMPIMNGLDFLKATLNPPMVIITTAYPSYALEGFQLNVLDYLVKPITFDRFYRAVTKARDYNDLVMKSNIVEEKNAKPAADYFFIKCELKYERIYFEDILYIQGLQNYVTIYTLQKKYVTLLSLKSVEENLNSQDFIRVHKSYIVSTSKIDSIEGNEILIQSSRIPLSRNYRSQVIDKVVNSRLWSRTGENN